MTMTKPFYKRTAFVVLLCGVVLTFVGLIFIVDSVLSSTYTYIGIWYGIFFGMGQGYFICSGALRQYEKKLDARNVEQKTSQ